MIHLDLTHSSHSHAQTGIQQVARGLARELIGAGETEAVVFDKYADRWRPLDRREHAHLATVEEASGTRRKRPHWSTWQRLRGRWQRRLGHRGRSLAETSRGLIVPEFYDDSVRDALPRWRARSSAPDLAIFHDAIAFFHPEWGVPQTVARYPAYLRSLAAFRGVACVSEFSKGQLLRAWEHLGVTAATAVRTVPLGLRPETLGPRPGEVKTDRAVPRLLCISTIEPRKNHEALLHACERLWSTGYRFSLELIGMLNRGFASPVPALIAAAQAAGRPLAWQGAVSAAVLHATIREADLTIYPSHCEGFGLPVWESLYFGVPCLTTTGGALAEVAPGGGCLLAAPDAAGLEIELRSFLDQPERRARLRAEARARPLRTLQTYAGELRSFLDELGPRP